jgi:hypothetical protein
MSIALILPDSGDACSIYRGAPWRKLGVPHATYDGKKGFNLWQSILEHDVVLMQRPFTAQQANIAQVVKDCGKKLIVDWDDPLHLLPPWNANKKAFEGCEPHLRTLAQLADVVTVTSKALHAHALAWGAKDARIIRNAIDDTFKCLPKLPRAKAVLWRGSNTHAADLDAGREYLTRMNKTHEIIFVGDAPAWAYQLRHRHFGVTDYANYIVTLHKLAPEIVAVPLADHPFNHAKSDIGAQEAWAIGAKLWHNGIGEFKDLPEVSEPRWLSDVNHLRMEVLRDFLSSRA